MKSGKKLTKKTGKPVTTIPQLAEMMQREFLAMRHDLASREETNQGFARLDTRIDAVEQKLNTMHTEMLGMHFDYKKVKGRLESIEIRVFGSIQEP